LAAKELSSPAEKRLATRTEMLLAILLYWLLVAGYQYWSGAPREAFSGYPDEPSHYLSGLMVRDYMVNGLDTSPVAFAVNYYTHTPFLAVGYWPPLFYGIEGAWMLMFGYQRATVLLLVALVAALLSGTIFQLLTPHLGRVAAFLFGLTFLMTPAAQWSNRLIMVDTTFTLLTWWAALAFAVWAETESPGDALITGLLAAGALLTKINSMYLFLLPIAFVLVTRRWSLLRRFSFWIIPTTVTAIWGPWYFLTRDLMAIGFGGIAYPSVLSIVAAVGRTLVDNLAWLVLLLLGGMVYVFRCARTDYRLLVCMLLPVCYAIFLVAARVAIEGRFLLPILAPSMVLAGIAVSRLAAKWAWPGLSAGRLGVLLAAAGVAAFAALPGVERDTKASDPVRPVVDSLSGRGAPEDISVLVPSIAEGPFIAEFAMNDRRRPARLLVRPLKLLSRITWNGGSYQQLFHDPDELVNLFDRFPVQYTILAPEPCHNCFPADELLRKTLRSHPERWTPISAPGDAWDIYQRTDGKQLPAAAMENLAGQILNPRLSSILTLGVRRR
jgi:hypothetical protein